MHPNCDPAGNTWRCITIMASSSSYTFASGGNDCLPNYRLAVGPGEPHIAIHAKDESQFSHVMSFTYTGSGGSCVEDYRAIPTPPYSVVVSRWSCTPRTVDRDPTPLFIDFDLKVVGNDYPLIALGFRWGEP